MHLNSWLKIQTMMMIGPFWQHVSTTYAIESMLRRKFVANANMTTCWFRIFAPRLLVRLAGFRLIEAGMEHKPGIDCRLKLSNAD